MYRKGRTTTEGHKMKTKFEIKSATLTEENALSFFAIMDDQVNIFGFVSGWEMEIMDEEDLARQLTAEEKKELENLLIAEYEKLALIAGGTK